MEEYKRRLAMILAETGALFFDDGLVLKDGRPTPYFVNVGMFCDGRLAMEQGTFFAEMIVDRKLVRQTDIILGPSYKGSAIAVSTAIALQLNHGKNVMYEYDRKEVKSHGEGSRDSSLFVNGTFFDGCGIYVVDDVATSMGTKHDLLKSVEREAEVKKIAVKVVGIGIAIDREQTTAVYDDEGRVVEGVKGENAIKKFTADTRIPVHAVAGISEVIEYLYQDRVPVMNAGKRRPMDEATKVRFDKYMMIYGAD